MLEAVLVNQAFVGLAVSISLPVCACWSSQVGIQGV